MSNLTPVLITRTKIHEMLGGISRTTFYRLRKKWENAGTPFPSLFTKIGAPKGGALYRYEEVMGFFRKMKLL